MAAILYRFMGGVADGSNPVESLRSSTGARTYAGDSEQPGFGALAISKSGTIYGTTENGGGRKMPTGIESHATNGVSMNQSSYLILGRLNEVGN